MPAAGAPVERHAPRVDTLWASSLEDRRARCADLSGSQTFVMIHRHVCWPQGCFVGSDIDWSFLSRMLLPYLTCFMKYRSIP